MAPDLNLGMAHLWMICALSIPQDQHMETPLAAPVATFWSFQDLIYTSSDVDSENAARDCGICLYSV